MKTPVWDFAHNYLNKKTVRLHMPGHKGCGDLGVEGLDITEIEGADVLYSSEGIIKESEENAAGLFESKKTVYSAEGSSLSIRAMLYLVCQYAKLKNQRPVILAGRNAHKTFISASALLDIDVRWIFPKNNSVLSCEINLENLEKEIIKEKPTAVYITSPDYLGYISDIKGISSILKEYGVLLLVDNAHGAYLKFLENSLHPIDLGADMCVDSAHKTLPVLTGGGYLHISKDAPDFFALQAYNAFSLFASTSPSYLILQSLDKANASLEKDFPVKVKNISEKTLSLKERLIKNGYTLVGNEPLKITINAKSYGYTGYQLARILEKNNIVSEFYDPDYLVLMVSVNTKECELNLVQSVLCGIEKLPPITEIPLGLEKPKVVMSPKEAVMKSKIKIPAQKALGKVLGSVSVNCPPAVPIVVCGEEINASALKLFEYYNINTCYVVES